MPVVGGGPGLLGLAAARGPAGYGCHADPYPAIIRPGAALAQLVEHRIRNKKLYNKLYNENKVLDFFSDGLYTL